MAKERRDSKNRVLWKGEYQKEDGRYMYRYTDPNGKARFIYSWTLTKSDRAPKGKPPGPCLRDLEKEIAKDIHDEIDTFTSKNTTLNDYFEMYLSEKKKLKATTRRVYRQNYDVYLRNRIGSRRLSTIKYSDVKKCYNDIIEKDGISVSTLSTIDAVLKPILRMATRDNLLRNNPAVGALSDVAKDMDSKATKKQALTVRQQDAFLDYVNQSAVYKKWKNLFTVMLGTGCRIGEICGLTWDDCDFINDTIHINRTLCYSADEFTGKYRLLIQPPKSDAGKRSIPMFTDVKQALQKERISQMKNGFCETCIDGVSGFVFCNRDRGVLLPCNLNSTINRITESYNKQETKQAAEEKREPVLLPKFSPHILRHTFCTRLCETGMNIKVIQEVMGHSKITMTMDIYNTVTDDFKATSFQNVEGMFRIG